jgi:HK97 family phage prohead protease
VDRVRDRIVPGAFANTIRSWQKSGKMVPVHWDHRGEAANVIGFIDPASMRETAEGLQVAGKLDISDSETAREAWRSMKNGTMSLSFGYITTKSRKLRTESPNFTRLICSR